VKAKAGKKGCKHVRGGKKRCRKHRKAPTEPVAPPLPDRTPPPPPTLSATSPLSPGNGTHPLVLGSAEADSTVSIYSNAACTNMVGSGSAARLASPGVVVTVLPDSTTRLYGTATDAASNSSDCSATPLDYAEAPVEIDATPSLTPGFAPDVSDYTVPCDGTNPVSMSVTAPNGSSVSVDGAAPASGNFTSPVTLQSNQEFDFDVAAGDYSGSYHVRCLPPDFPQFTYERLSPPTYPFYLVDPDLKIGSLPKHWVVVFDDHGVPVWWANPGVAPVDSKVLSDGTIAWAGWDGSGYSLHALDGSVVATVAGVGGTTDIHDLQELPNGDYLLLRYVSRSHVDLSAYGGPADTIVQDGVVQEIDPDGNLVWEWNSKDHISLAETGRWWPSLLNGGPPYDLVHINAVEPDGSALLISLRQTDAVYKIDRSTGNVIWKLGGTTTPQSLAVVDDPESYPLGGQHDPRLQPDGTITIHDNGTFLNRPPRAVRYAIDEEEGTATLAESVSDPQVTSSICCGSARRSPHGSWLMSWGGNPVVTEFAANRSRNFRLTFDDSWFSYRAFPVPSGLLSAAALRAGMDAQFPRP
jgi:Arylsulfotransferase (ASST)